MARTNRLRRKDIKQPDEFITLSGHAVAWIRSNTQVAYGVGAAFIVLMGTLGVLTAYRAAQNREANTDLANALAARRGKDQAAAAGELSAAAGRWRGTLPGDVAAILAASSALRAGKPDSAILTLQDLFAAPDRLEPYLRQESLFTWGAALEQQAKPADAAEKYAAAAAIQGPYSGLAVLGQARTAAQLGQADKAKELYLNYYNQFPDAPDRDIVRDKSGL